jgi:hypothetical protein
MSSLSAQQKQWLDDACNGTISSEDLALMEAALMESAEYRRLARRYFAMDSYLQAGANDLVAPTAEPSPPEVVRPGRASWTGWAIALAAALIFVMGAALGPDLMPRAPEEIVAVPAEPIETPTPAEMPAETDDGIAVIKYAVDAVWADDADQRLGVGSILSPGPLKLVSGVAQLEFYNGARLIIEGAADLELVSVERVICRQGKLRGEVPPGAEGFTVSSSRFELVDLGTEFGIEVNANGDDKVVVFDGEVALYGPNGSQNGSKGRRLLGGSGVEWNETGEVGDIQPEEVAFISQAELKRKQQDVLTGRVSEWRRWQQDVRADSRVVAHYAFGSQADRLPDDGSSELHGVIIGSEWTDGRLPDKRALEFKRPGDRVRIDVPGVYDAVTVAAWVRVDAIPSRRQSLLMADSHELGHLQWMLGDKGELRFNARIKRGGQATSRGYQSPPVFVPRKLGVWTHVCLTYDRDAAKVGLYADGRLLVEHNLAYDQPLQIGSGDIGNWSKHTGPIRNFVGRIDGLTIWGAALSEAEISDAHQRTRP